MVTCCPLALALDEVPAPNEVIWVIATQCHRCSAGGMLTGDMGSREDFPEEVTARTHLPTLLLSRRLPSPVPGPAPASRERSRTGHGHCPCGAHIPGGDTGKHKFRVTWAKTEVCMGLERVTETAGLLQNTGATLDARSGPFQPGTSVSVPRVT